MQKLELGTADQTAARINFIRQIAGSNLGWGFGYRAVFVVHDRLVPSPFNHYLLTVLHLAVTDGARDGAVV